MSCAFSKETLALHVEGDLPRVTADKTAQHLERCQECREFFDALQDSQSLLKSIRRESASPSECAAIRSAVMSTLERQDQLGWALWIERTIMLTVRRPAYALATCALLGIVSASVLAQMRQAPAPGVEGAVAIFEGRDMLVRPDDYRGWILVSEASAPQPRGADDIAQRKPTHRVYIDPEGYRAYKKTGAFSEGTVLVRESLREEPGTTSLPHAQSATLLASVKDGSRFDGGPGYFDFSGRQGGVRAKASLNSELSGCRTCHLEEGETDSVFTQFYSALRSTRQGRQRDEVSKRSAWLEESLVLPRLPQRSQSAFAWS